MGESPLRDISEKSLGPVFMYKDINICILREVWWSGHVRSNTRKSWPEFLLEGTRKVLSRSVATVL